MTSIIFVALVALVALGMLVCLTWASGHDDRL